MGRPRTAVKLIEAAAQQEGIDLPIWVILVTVSVAPLAARWKGRSSRHLPLPTTYGPQLTHVLPPEALLAGTGLKPQDLNDLARRISVRQALRYIANTLHLAPRPTGIWLGWGPIIAEC